MMHGIVRVVLGIAMVLTYNVWDMSWKTIISILGWLLLLSGAGLLFLPQLVEKAIAKLRNSDILSIVLTCIVLLGCVLIYFGFTA